MLKIMDVKTAIDIIKNNKKIYPNPDVQYVWDKAIDMAINALDKQDGKTPVKTKPLTKNVKIGNTVFAKGISVLCKCPTCKMLVKPKQKYCRECGQSIDWN